MKTGVWIAAAFCLLCGVLGQLPAEDAQSLKFLSDAWNATMKAATVKITREQTTSANAEGDDNPTEQKISTTLYLR